MAAASCFEPALLPSPAPFSLSGPMMAPHRTDPSLQAAARNFQGVGSCLVLVPGTTDSDIYLQQRHNIHQHLSPWRWVAQESSPEPFPNTKGPLRPT